MHVGEAMRHADDFYGRTVVVAARIGALAFGGEILASSLVRGLAEGLGTFTFDEPRKVTLKGFDGSFDVYSSRPDGAHISRSPLQHLRPTRTERRLQNAAPRAGVRGHSSPRVMARRQARNITPERALCVRRFLGVDPPGGVMQLDGRRIIVTGGAGGIGAATVRAFAGEGARVVSLDIRDDEGDQIADDAARKGPGGARYCHCDITDRATVDAVFSDAVEDLGGLDVLANMAGVEGHAPAATLSDEEWDRVFVVNVKGTVYTNQAAYRAMCQSGGGRIINVGSDAGLVANPNGGHYSASKGAVMSWTRSAAAEWGRDRVTVNALVPMMSTPMYERYRASLTTEALAQHDAQLAAGVPLGGKLGDPDSDLGPVMVFLASEGARFITGQLISVNGGANPVR
jgi:NAD(P)-dependent dehydrogenase (short-subunit alcohol dehydrogenase family)